MPAWTPKRARAVVRRKDGTFKRWRGGLNKRELGKKENNFHGIATHIGQEFKAEHGRRARTGDIHRTRNKDGTFNAHAWWYIKTPHGWRKSPHGTRRPTKQEIRRVIAGSRRGR